MHQASQSPTNYLGPRAVKTLKEIRPLQPSDLLPIPPQRPQLQRKNALRQARGTELNQVPVRDGITSELRPW
jgi:hypothetical protein